MKLFFLLKDATVKPIYCGLRTENAQANCIGPAPLSHSLVDIAWFARFTMVAAGSPHPTLVSSRPVATVGTRACCGSS